MIRIAKMPFIQEDTDRWGIPTGTFSVVDIQGEIDEEMWTKIQEYEGYYISEEGQAEIKAVQDASRRSHHGIGVDNIRDMMPYMNKLIGYCNSQLWQFNLRASESEYETKYFRTYAIFGEKTLYAWSTEHDVKVRLLKEQAVKMSNT